MNKTPLLCDESRPGARAVSLPPAGVPGRPIDQLLPPRLLRKSPADLPELTELQVTRHFTRLSQKNFSVDTQFYPLGSCTMKFNPRIDEAMASLPGFGELHPYQPDADCQGALELMHELEQMLCAVLGLHAASLQPCGGAHGELTGLLCIRACHRDRNDSSRTRVLVPDSAHGTNPATVTLVGMEAISVRAAADGGIDLDDLAAKLDSRTAALMITNPSTLGLFERRIARAAEMVHRAGGLVYMDGANLNAIIGVARPGDFGVDVMHVNVHKTLSAPHGGGGPGAGPIAVAQCLEPYLPVPRVARDGDGYRRIDDRPRSIGRVRAFFGQFANLVRAYCYLRVHSRADLAEVARQAVLNANYVLARLKDDYELPFPAPCMHEVVLSARRQKASTGVRAYDIAKRLLDYGFHAPTMYFPQVVPEALMIEPTETESKQTLDEFCEAMIRIAREAEEQPELLFHAPSKLPVTRVDEAAAARHPVLNWQAAVPPEKPEGNKEANGVHAPRERVVEEILSGSLNAPPELPREENR